MGQVRTLVRYRIRRFANRVLSRGIALRLFVVAAGMAVLIGAGWILSPEAFGPVRVRGGVVHWGGWSLETAFYLACLMAAVQSFRILESFFRHWEARILAVFPVKLRGLFFYRLGASVLDTTAFGSGCVLFLLPVWIKGGGFYFFWSLGLLALAVLLIVAVGFAAQMAAGVANYQHLPGFFSELDRRSGGTGGGAAAYLFSPAIALACTLFLLLFGKLSIEELLRTYQPNQSGGTGIALVAGLIFLAIIGGCLLWAYRNFTRHYPLLFARFFESDLVVLDVGFDYFAKDRKPPRGLEARLAGPLRSLYRLDRLQQARRTPLARLLWLAGPALALILFLSYGDRLESWMVLGIGLAWLLVLTNPFSRLFHPAMDPGWGKLLPVADSVRERARRILLLREIAWLGLPLALCGLVLPTWETRLVLFFVPILGIALIPLFSSLAASSYRAPRAVGFLVAAIFAGLTHLGLVGPLVGTLLVGLGATAWARSNRPGRWTDREAQLER